MNLHVNELFYSVQGEGARAGEPSIFVRLAGCSAWAACAQSGVACDTEFASWRSYTVDELLAAVRALTSSCRWIVWTGGEPTDQLTAEIVAAFTAAGYYQAIETSGVRPVPAGLDWVTVSPKVAEHILARHFPQGVHELKYVRHAGQGVPVPSIAAQYMYLMPHSDGGHLNRENIEACVALCLAHPQFRLCVQQHKVWRVR